MRWFQNLHPSFSGIGRHLPVFGRNPSFFGKAVISKMPAGNQGIKKADAHVCASACMLLLHSVCVFLGYWAGHTGRHFCNPACSMTSILLPDLRRSGVGGNLKILAYHYRCPRSVCLFFACLMMQRWGEQASCQGTFRETVHVGMFLAGFLLFSFLGRVFAG